MSLAKTIFLALAITFSFNGHASNYCAAIRGNGELIPAHWGALSRIVEHSGLPAKAAGGSSASMTMFLLDGISRNNFYSEDKKIKNLEQALLIKSIYGHLLFLANEDAKVPEIMRFVSNLSALGKSSFIKKLQLALKIARDVPTMMAILGKYGPLLNPEIVKGLKSNFSFHKSQLSEAVSTLGSFDAKTDTNIFFREGIVDFKFVALLLGRVADFYAGHGETKTNQKLKKFVKACAINSAGKLWNEIVENQPECKEIFESALSDYYAPKRKRVRVFGQNNKRSRFKTVREFPNKMIFESIGSGLNALPTTSLLVGTGVDKYKEAKSEYISKEAEGLTPFSIDFNSELRLGYWGANKTLDKIESNLERMYPQDLKSSKFYKLKSGSWFEVLATSPAEPGLANLQEIPSTSGLVRNQQLRITNKRYFAKKFNILPTLSIVPWSNFMTFRKGIISAGGWSDLHPSLVLKAAGCENVMYITRQDGESVFGQQFFIRLIGEIELLPFWKDIPSFNRVGKSDLTLEQEQSTWNRLYNLANPNSSYNLSVEESDLVYCTNWNAYSVFKKQINELIQDAFDAPLFAKNPDVRDEYNFGYDIDGKSEDGFPGCIPRD